jgi:hypothetical protein
LAIARDVVEVLHKFLHRVDFRNAPMWRNGRPNGLKNALFSISLHFKIDQIERNSPGEIAQIREFRLRIGAVSKKRLILAHGSDGFVIPNGASYGLII